MLERDKDELCLFLELLCSTFRLPDSSLQKILHLMRTYGYRPDLATEEPVNYSENLNFAPL
jgi:hypothetical protein